MENEKHICVYCGDEARYQLKNGKWCCTPSANQCPFNKQKRVIASTKQWEKVKASGETHLKGTKTSEKVWRTTQLVDVPEGYCQYGCGNKALFTLANGVQCCSDHTNRCPALRKKNSEGLKQAYLNGTRDASCAFGDAARQKSIIVKRTQAVQNDFVKGSTAANHMIINLMRNTLNIPYKCAICGINTWQNKSINLELDHIDGDSSNNEIENLRFLCPNCHSQTDTFRGRNVNTGKIRISDEVLKEALQVNANIRQALISVGLAPKGANYARAYKLKCELISSTTVND